MYFISLKIRFIPQHLFKFYIFTFNILFQLIIIEAILTNKSLYLLHLLLYLLYSVILLFPTYVANIYK